MRLCWEQDLIILGWTVLVCVSFANIAYSVNILLSSASSRLPSLVNFESLATLAEQLLEEINAESKTTASIAEEDHNSPLAFGTRAYATYTRLYLDIYSTPLLYVIFFALANDVKVMAIAGIVAYPVSLLCQHALLLVVPPKRMTQVELDALASRNKLLIHAKRDELYKLHATASTNTLKGITRSVNLIRSDSVKI